MVIGNVYLITAIAVIGGGLFGYGRLSSIKQWNIRLQELTGYRFDISSMSAIIGTQQYKCYFNQGSPDNCTGPTSSVQGGITASMAGGSFVAALCSGFLSDMFGRKTSIMIGSCIW